MDYLLLNGFDSSAKVRWNCQKPMNKVNERDMYQVNAI